ncbi:MAG TPA: hypothetical protein VLF62_01720 [Candidatus Saccharimonadales bacterium]|nr:hypothetical protein [Candidatus Saccharimonadales bacterium]
MNTQQKKRFIIFGSLALFIGLIYILSMAFRGGTQITQFTKVPATTAEGTAFGTDTLLYANDAALETFNYKTGKRTPISPSTGQNGLDNVDTVTASANKKFVLFHTSVVTYGELLSKQLAADGRSEAADYWWVYSIADRSFQALPDGTLLAKFQGNKLYALAPNSDGEAIYTYNPATLEETSNLQIEPSSDFFPVKNGFLLQSIDNKIYFTSNGTTNEEVLSDIQISGITADGNTVVGLENKNKAQSLVWASTSDWEVHVISDSVSSKPVWDNSGKVLYNTSGASTDFVEYNLVTDKSSTWKFNKDALPPRDDAPAIAQVLLSDDTAVISNSSGVYYLSGPQVHEFKN